MDGRKKIIMIIQFFTFFTIFGTYILSYASEFAVVSNPSAPEMTPDDVKKIYLGSRKTLPDKTPATPLIIKGLPEKFYQTITGLTKKQFIQHWMIKIVAGEIEIPPQEIEEDEAIKIIKREKGAIGVISTEKAKQEGLKILVEIK